MDTLFDGWFWVNPEHLFSRSDFKEISVLKFIPMSSVSSADAVRMFSTENSRWGINQLLSVYGYGVRSEESGLWEVYQSSSDRDKRNK